MRHRFKRVAFIAVLLSFIWGAWWGFYQDYKKRPERWGRTELSLLAFDDQFPTSLQEKLARNEDVFLKVKVVTHPQAFLREVLTHGSKYDLIQFNSFLADSFLIENVFAEVETERLPNLQNISIDFQNLNFDPNSKFLIPLQWGVNGFIYKSDKVDNISTLEELGQKFTLLPQAPEVYAYAAKIKPIIKNWAATGNEEELLKDLKAITSRFPNFSLQAKDALLEPDNVAAQISNGQAAKLLSENKILRYDLPTEKANLWVGVIGVTRDSRKKRAAFNFINLLLEPKWSEELVRANQEATVNVLLDSSDSVLPEQKAQYIRELRLSRFELFYDHEAFEPLWLRAIKETFPSAFNSQESKQ